MDWVKLGAELLLPLVGAAFGTGVTWGLFRGHLTGQLEQMTSRATQLTERDEELQRNLTAAHRRLDDVERRVIRLEAQLEFMAKRHDEVIKDLRDALLRIESRLEEALGRQRGQA